MVTSGSLKLLPLLELMLPTAKIDYNNNFKFEYPVLLVLLHWSSQHEKDLKKTNVIEKIFPWEDGFRLSIFPSLYINHTPSLSY